MVWYASAWRPTTRRSNRSLPSSTRWRRTRASGSSAVWSWGAISRSTIFGATTTRSSTPRAPRPTGGWNPGEGLRGSHPATEFVAWYNGHPDFRDHQFDLSQERAAIVGVGNVAVDVARVLSRSVDELAKTDIADYALDALRQSRIRRSISWADGARPRRPSRTPRSASSRASTGRPRRLAGGGRARPAQPPGAREQPGSGDIEEGGDSPGVRPTSALRKAPAADGALSRLAGGGAGWVQRRGHRAASGPQASSSPGEAGSLQAKPTGEFEELPVGLVFRSVGYKGVPLPGVPLRELGRDPQRARPRAGPRDQEAAPGRVRCRLDQGCPPGVIGTNKPDAGETVAGMMKDVAQGRLLEPVAAVQAIARLVSERQPVTSRTRTGDGSTSSRWLGAAAGRPRSQVHARQGHAGGARPLNSALTPHV